MLNQDQDTQENELEFRIWFRDEFGMDYLEALEKLKNMKQESERKWQQSLMNNTFK